MIKELKIHTAVRAGKPYKREYKSGNQRQHYGGGCHVPEIFKKLQVKEELPV